MEEIIQDKKSGFLFGDEAVARGGLEAGVGFVSSYPGTPASEIADTFAKIAKNVGLYFEYSTNEKVALEAAAGAAFSGVKSLVIMKHYGLNVALDSLLPLVYLGCPLVVVVADDPGCFSSVQTEQDSRWYSKLGKIPTLEPTNPQEAKDMTSQAFKIAQNFKIPVLIRLTTRVAYAKTDIKFGDIPTIENKGEFPKDPRGFKLGSQQTVKLHKKILEKIEQIKKEISETDNYNFVENGQGRFGIVVSGVSYDYVKEILAEMGLNLPILKIGMSYPFPAEMAKKFLSNLNQVLVCEEIDPICENELKMLAKDIKSQLKIHGKDLLPKTGEYGPEDIEVAIAKILNRKVSRALSENIEKFKSLKIPPRIPFWCPGCPHRATFTAVKKALGSKGAPFGGKDIVFGGDIGCYMLGAYPPTKMLDYVVSMGAGTGIAHGIAKTNPQKPIAFIGDSTFFHAGIPALLNMVFNKADILVIVLDNRYTAMTGQQPHPGTGVTGAGQKTKQILIEDIAKAAGADFVETINVYNLAESIKKINQMYDKKGVSVVVAKGECRLVTVRKMKAKGQKLPKFEIKKQSPKLKQLRDFSCPAISERKGKFSIDSNLCTGCSVCKQIEPDFIGLKSKEKNAE